MNKACCFSGHRDLPEDKLPVVRSRIKQGILNFIDNGGKFFACGGAIGFDMLAAEEVLAVKKNHPQIQLILILPFPDYTSKWPEAEKRRLETIMEQSIYKYTGKEYHKGIYFARDRELVNGSDTCICYLSKKEHSGTRYTVNYALDKGLWITNIADDAFWAGTTQIPDPTILL